MRTVYIILAHQLPTQAVRLMRRLATPDSMFLLHWDRRSADSDLAFILRQLDSECDVRPLPRHACYWGTFSIVAATMEGIEAACADQKGFDRLVLLSGQDYPIKPLPTIAAVFESHRHLSFVHHVPFPKADWHGGGWDRVRLRWTAPPASQEGQEPIPIEPMLPRPFPEGLHPYGGTQFWAITEEAARYIQEFTGKHPDVWRFFEEVFVPDEIYFQTVLGCSPLADKLENNPLHFVKWQRPGKVLVASDIGDLTNIPHLFARKFDQRVDEQILRLIDERVLGA